jgi:hypothetical protein
MLMTWALLRQKYHRLESGAETDSGACRIGGELVKWSWSVRSLAASRRILSLLVVVWGLQAGLARAQAPGGPTPDGFDLNVGMGMRLTNNPGLASDGGSREGDSITDLRADVTGRRRSPRTEWSSRYTPFYTRYGSNSQFDTLNHALNLDARYVVSPRSRLGLLERFYSSRDLSQVDTGETAGEAVILTRLTRRWRNFADAAFDASLSRSLSLQLGASSRIERFDLSPSVDSNMDSGRLGIRKQIGREDAFSTTYSYSRFGFQGAGVDGAESQGMDLSWSHGIPTRTDWTLSAGVSKVSRASERENRITASASLHHPFRRMDFVSGYRRGLGADSGVANVTVAEDAHAGISARIGQRASMTVRGEYGSRDSVLESGDRIALTYTGGALLGTVTLNPHLNIAAEARRRSQDVTSGTGDDLTVNTFFLRLELRVF